MAKTPEFDLRENSKNYIINGDMKISQRFETLTASSIGSGQYLVDRFVYTKSGAMVHNFVQDTDAPTLAESGYLFTNSLRLTLTTPDTVIAASDNVSVNQYVEGHNWANLAQKPFSLSFWVKATLPGTYCVAFRNGGGDRAYIAEYTISAANTWEKKIINVSASPSAGTWNYTNGMGLDIRWTIASGTDYHTTANTWQTGNRLATVNQVNGANTGATDFKLTGVMLNEGYEALPFRLFAGDFNGELLACQRYYEKSYAAGVTPGTPASGEAVTIRQFQSVGSAVRIGNQFFVRKRTAPSSFIPYSGVSGTPNTLSINNISQAVTAQAVNDVGFWVENNTINPTGSFTLGVLYAVSSEL